MDFKELLKNTDLLRRLVDSLNDEADEEENEDALISVSEDEEYFSEIEDEDEVEISDEDEVEISDEDDPISVDMDYDEDDNIELLSDGENLSDEED